MSRYSLRSMVGGKPVRFRLHDGPQLVGRSRGCEIALNSAAVSRRHAAVVVESDRVLVRDLGSRNGTLVNGNPVRNEVELLPGDRVQIGPVSLALMLEESSTVPSFSDKDTTAAVQDVPASEVIQTRAARRHDRVLGALYETGQMLSRRMDLVEVYESVLDIVSRFIPADRYFILQRDTRAGKHTIAARRIKSGDERRELRFSRRMIQEIMEGGRALRTLDAAQDSRWKTDDSVISLGVHAALGAPLYDNEKVLGAIYLDTSRPGVRYEAEDLDLLTLLGNMVAVKITHSRLEREERQLERIQDELALAERIQMNLLPRVIPEIDGYETFAHLVPCERVGGDLYDVRKLPDGNLWVTLGDVSGHGIAAAILMSHVMAGLRFLEEQSVDPLTLVSQLESKLSQHTEDWQFVTLFAGVLEPATGRLLYVNAGHWAPVILGEGRCQRLEATGTPVALLAGIQPRTLGECRLDPGSSLLIFSDGIPECRRGDEPFHERHFPEFVESSKPRVSGLSAEAIGHALLDRLDEFRGEEPVDDDVTLLVLKRRT